MRTLLASRRNIIIEAFLAFLILASIVYTFIFVIVQGYLPQPFYYGSQSLFTDWTATAYFANHTGQYTAFASVYPPLSFVFLNIFSIHECYQNDDIFMSRDCDWLMWVTLFSFFVANAFIAYRAYLVVDRRTAMFRAFAIGFGLPSLYALERGNLIIPCFTFFMLGNGRILKSARQKWVAAAMAINFKPYLVMSLLGQLFGRRWRFLEGCVIAGLAVYLITFAWNGDGNPIQVLSDIRAFVTTDAKGIFERCIYASSYKPIIDLINSNFPLLYFLPSRPVEIMQVAMPLAIDLAKYGTLCVFGLMVWKPGVIPVFRISALAIGWILVTQDPGGYAVLYYFFFVFMEKWKGPFLTVALMLTYLMSTSMDLMIIKISHEPLFSYLTKREVGYDLGVNLGELVRPGAMLIVEYALIGASVWDVLARLKRPRDVYANRGGFEVAAGV